MPLVVLYKGSCWLSTCSLTSGVMPNHPRKRMSTEETLAAGCVPAVCCLQMTKVPVGEYLLQNAANSVLGKQLIALCRKRGIKTINLVRPRCPAGHGELIVLPRKQYTL